VQTLLTILSQTAILAPLGVGIALIYRLSNVINFAAGSMAVFLGYCSASMGNSIGGVVATLAVGALVGTVAYVMAVWPAQVLKVPPVGIALATLGFAIALEAVGETIFGGSAKAADAWVAGSFHVAGVNVTYQRLISIVVGIAVTVIVTVLFDRSMVGRTMEACAADEELAQLYGVRPRGFHLLAWATAGVCCAVTGILQVGIASISSSLALQLLNLAIIGAVVGGVGGLAASSLGVLTVAVVGTLSQRYINSNFVVTPIFVLLLIGLFVRPQGIFQSTKTSERA
jgi:branched-subunit amino acid ABC-type transport system permease component